MNHKKKTSIAIFDFDGTITYHDTLFSFLVYTKGWIKTLGYLFLESPWLIGYLLGMVSRQKAKEKVLERFFKGTPSETLKKLGKSFALNTLQKHLKPEALEKIRWHQNQGHRCLLLSASINAYLDPWAQSLGFEKAITSELQIDHSQKVTGHLVGNNCWGPEKLSRLKKEFNSRDDVILYVYGDSRGDKEILEYADYPFYKKF